MARGLCCTPLGGSQSHTPRGPEAAQGCEHQEVRAPRVTLGHPAGGGSSSQLDRSQNSEEESGQELVEIKCY